MLAEHDHKSPDLITQEELRQHFLFRKNVSGWSLAARTIALCGIKFFYENTLKRDWTTVNLVKPRREKFLPVVLSVEEVRRTIERVHMFRHRVCLSTIYSCGLRLTEGRTQNWVIDTIPLGSGEAALKYLAPYVFRVAINNKNILALEHGDVTFRYRDSQAHTIRTATVTAEELMAGADFGVPAREVLRTAIASGCTAYDSEFVVLAQDLGVKLITLDRAVLKAFPTLAQPLVPPGTPMRAVHG